MRRIHLLISGIVQGVFYRHNTNIQANEFGLKGWVKNLPDGRVEVIAEGEEEKLKLLISWCHEGPEEARVDNVEIEWQDYKGEFESFSVRY